MDRPAAAPRPPRPAALGKRHVGDLSDPFRVSAVAPAALGDRPGLLADEAAQLSLTGETRLVRLEGATDAAAEPCRILLENEHAAALAIVEAGELPPRSKLRKLFEDAPDAAAIACYADDEAAVSRLIRATFDEAGISVTPDAVAFLAARLGADRKITRSELDKLTLYAADSRSITLEDAAVKALRPPVFFKRNGAFREALRLWSAAEAGEALERLVEAEAACKRTGSVPAALCAEALLGIAREARAGR